MLYSDQQYAPEMIPTLIKPLVDGEADAVFGSRMMDPKGALKGGMPKYKFLGNKILTKIVLRYTYAYSTMVSREVNAYGNIW